MSSTMHNVAGLDGEDPDSDMEEQVEAVHAAVAQCLYIIFGLDMPHRSASWGGNIQVSSILLYTFIYI